MPWYTYIAYFFAGVFLANGIPHFIHGISGKKFPSPFAKPPGIGKSSPLVNVLWGTANFVVGYVLVFKVGHFEFGYTKSALMVGVEAFITAIMLAFSFRRVQGGE